MDTALFEVLQTVMTVGLAVVAVRFVDRWIPRKVFRANSISKG